MSYEFIANSMFIFTVTLASGLVRDIEFDAGENGVFSYSTQEKEVADAIRRHPLVKRGCIIVKSEPQPRQELAQVDELGEEQDSGALVFDNITKARNYLVKTYGVDAKTLKTPASLMDCAKANGIKIKF